jgi:hypothetical protein
MKHLSKIASVCLATVFCAAFATTAKAIPLTIVQTSTWTGGGGSFGSLYISSGGNFDFLPSSANGTLISVQFDAQTSTHASVHEINQTSTPLLWRGNITSNQRFVFFNFTPAPFSSPLDIIAQSGPLATLTSYHDQSVFNADFLQSYSKLFTSPSDLLQFAGGGSGTNRITSANTVQGFTFYSATSAQQTGTMTLTYTYNTVPETTSSLALLALGFGAMALGFRFLPRRSSV